MSMKQSENVDTLKSYYVHLSSFTRIQPFRKSNQNHWDKPKKRRKKEKRPLPTQCIEQGLGEGKIREKAK